MPFFKKLQAKRWNLKFSTYKKIQSEDYEPELLDNQPYDETLDISNSEELASLDTRTPRQAVLRNTSLQQLNYMASSGNDESEDSIKQKKTGPPARPCEPAETDDEDYDEEDDDEEDSDDTESDEDDGEPRPAPEGAYDPSDYDHLHVSSDIKDIFQFITRYTPQNIELDHKLKPFIPDFIPAVGDIDAFLKVPRPDGKVDGLGLVVLDEPCAKQSDPVVLSMGLSENRKQHNVAEVKVKSIESAQKNPKAIDDWIDSVSELHRSKPPATVLYTRPMPDIDTLMQEWPPEFEELLGKQKKTGPPARPCEPAETDEEDDDDEDDSDDTESDEDYGAPRPAPERYTPQTTVMDKPCAKQSDPTVLSPWLSENRKQHNVTEVKVKSIESAQKNPKAIDDWIDSVSQLHRSKPPATILYTRPMPDTDTLMQEWPPEFEELLGKPELIAKPPNNKTLDINDSGEVASLYAPTPWQAVLRNTSQQQLKSMANSSSDESEDSTKQKKTGPPARPCEPAETDEEDEEEEEDDSDDTESDEDEDDWIDSISQLHRYKPPATVLYTRPMPDIDTLMQEWPPDFEELLGKQKKTGPPARPCEPAESDEEDDDDEEEDSDETESDEDDGEPRTAPERYTTQTTVMDKPCAKQSDPTVLSPWLSENRKQHNVTEVKVKSIKSAQKNPKAIDDWIDSISQLHRSKPPATVLYTRPMPDIDTLMYEWPPDFEERLGKLIDNQPYNETLDIDDSEEVASLYTPTPWQAGDNRYTPQNIELDHKLKPFIPDFIPAVGDINAFLKFIDNPPYNETLDIDDSEEVASLYTPTPWQAGQLRLLMLRMQTIIIINLQFSWKPTGSSFIGVSPEFEPELLDNQPYDETLDISNSEELASLDTRTPRQAVLRNTSLQQLNYMASSGNDESEDSIKQKKTGPPARPCEPAETDDEDYDEEDDDEEDSDDTESDEDDGEPRPAPEGAYDPSDYDHLHVSSDIKDIFQFITRYTPQNIELDHKLKPFIPDFIPAVGDIDAFLKVPRPDGKVDGLGLVVLDEPCAKQSDPVVLSMGLSENSKQHNVAEVKVKSIESAQKNPKAIDDWIDSVSELHRSKPPATVLYTRPMPDTDTLMQEWPPEFEELLGKLNLPTADIDCDLEEYIDTICGILDIPVYESRIQSLHVLFSLYSEIRNFQPELIAKSPNNKTLDINDSGEVASLYAPTPWQAVLRNTSQQQLKSMANSSSDESEDSTKASIDPCTPTKHDEEDDEEEEEDSDDTESDEDDGEPRPAPERYTPQTTVMDKPCAKQSDPTVLSPWLSENRKQHNVTEVKVKSIESAQKNPKAIDDWIDSVSQLHRSKPPATVLYTRPMPDIDTLMQEWPPEFEELLGKQKKTGPPARPCEPAETDEEDDDDEEDDSDDTESDEDYGAPRPAPEGYTTQTTVMDKPCAKQSDPTVLSPWLSENRKQHNVTEVKVKSIESAQKNPKAIDDWIDSVSQLHRSKPPATVLYTRPMPDTDTLMQEWPPEFEELLGKPELIAKPPNNKTLDINDSGEVASLYAPTPWQAVLRNTSQQQLKSMANSSSDESEDSTKQKKTGPPARPCEPAESDEEDDDDEEEDSDETESDEDDGEPRTAPERAYDPSDYDHLHVSSDIKDIFQFITRYTPQNIELDHKLKPFIPDFIPAVGDIDAFLKVPRPDGKVDGLGLVVLDEPCAKQSDPVVLSMGLSENSKQHNVAEVKVKSIESAQKNPKAIDDWIDSVSELHRSKPPATVLYTRPMPDTDTLMQEWPPEFEELLGKLNLPTADIDCDLEEYIDTICGILDIPVYESRIQSLHVLFSLYSEIRNFQPELIAKSPNNKTLDINDSGEVASLYAPTPWQAVLRNTSQQQLKSMANSSSDESEDSTKEVKVKSIESAQKNPKAIDDWIDSISQLHRSKPPATVLYTRPMPDIDTLMQEWPPEFDELLGKQKKTGPPARPCEPAETDEEDDDDEEDDSDDTESDEDYGAPRPAPERYTPQTTVMDKPCAKQSDPTVLSPWLSENRKQHNVTEVKVKSIESAQKNPKAIDDWIDSVSQLHRSKPPATVLYTRPMPDTDTLMQEWPPEFEELLGKPELIAKSPNNKTLDINDSGEVASSYAPTPWQAVLRNTSQQQLKSMANSSSDESEDSIKQKKTGPPARPCEPAETDEEDDEEEEDDSDDTESDEDEDDWIDSISQLHRYKPPATVLYTRPMPDIDTLMQEWPPEFDELLGKQKKTGLSARPCEPAETDEEDDDDEEDDSDDTESDEDYGAPRPAPERYTTQTTVMDKPCAKQSDPTVLSPWLSENRKQHNVTEVKVKSIKSAQKNPKAIDDWIDSISQLHRSKPPATVLYTRPMPDTDTLMQEWPPEFEELLGKQKKTGPPARPCEPAETDEDDDDEEDDSDDTESDEDDGDPRPAPEGYTTQTTVMDKPCAKQSDPTVLSPWLSENRKQHNVTQKKTGPPARPCEPAETDEEDDDDEEDDSDDTESDEDDGDPRPAPEG
ncbi:hypothetical protein KOW79_016272 [Hemibagrus wyckioides]|uniref:Intraflagellar transport protein 46 homolog n=1 Tax=Hemibagrus wyckioides TaxID=337641 RepID=A0A9D3SIK4_9TELE|nr:hypothetical protein KOW79_016272 [Hemibagrus wyckioides]